MNADVSPPLHEPTLTLINIIIYYNIICRFQRYIYNNLSWVTVPAVPVRDPIKYVLSTHDRRTIISKEPEKMGKQGLLMLRAMDRLAVEGQTSGNRVSSCALHSEPIDIIYLYC